MAESKDKYTQTEARKLQDEVIAVFANKPKEWQAEAYAYLYNMSWRIKEANDLRRAKRLTQ